jgi:hypothetical protein
MQKRIRYTVIAALDGDSLPQVVGHVDAIHNVAESSNFAERAGAEITVGWRRRGSNAFHLLNLLECLKLQQGEMVKAAAMGDPAPTSPTE